MKTVDLRNKKVQSILEFLYERASNPAFIIDESSYKNSIDTLFQTTVWGFREILLVVIVGMKLDPSFRASIGLYDCNPRAIFEGPIKEFLIARHIPHRKSGPLNVAKAARGLDMTWAAQRRPSNVAREVVHLVDFLEASPESAASRIDSVGISLMRRLIAEAQDLASLTVEIQPTEDPEHLYRLCHELVHNAPDAGNTPQKIAALLLKSYHASLHTEIRVTGGEDRAFVTSTTSKKPGDINEEYADRICKVYEVTVKHFDLARIRDSYDCVSVYNESHDTSIDEIIVICRAEDCPSDMRKSGLQMCLGSCSYQNIRYYFWEINEWMAEMLERLTGEGRKAFYARLNNYINDINTVEAVKRVWKQLHSEQ